MCYILFFLVIVWCERRSSQKWVPGAGRHIYDEHIGRVDEYAVPAGRLQSSKSKVIFPLNCEGPEPCHKGFEPVRSVSEELDTCAFVVDRNDPTVDGRFWHFLSLLHSAECISVSKEELADGKKRTVKEFFFPFTIGRFGSRSGRLVVEHDSFTVTFYPLE